jgi:tetratricopeptide (TPR) repeat protein
MANVTLAREYWDKAFEYYFDGESERAIAAGRKALELNPRLARPHWIIGYAFIHRETPDREAAIKEFRQLVEKDPRWCEGHTALSVALSKQGRIDEALKCFREALRLKPKHPEVRIRLAQLLLKRKRLSRSDPCVARRRVTVHDFDRRLPLAGSSDGRKWEL